MQGRRIPLSTPLLTLALTIANLGLPSALAESVLFEEDWESGTDGWVVAGAQRDCSTAYSGVCSLSFQPCCPVEESVSRTLNAPLDGLTTITVAFKASTTAGGTDSNVELFLSNGGHIILHLTEGVNNGVSILSSGVRHIFASWPTANQWYVARIHLDPGRDVVWAELVGHGVSNELAIPATSGAILDMRFTAVTWGSSAATIHYDALRIERNSITPPAPPTGLTAAAGPGAGEITLAWSHSDPTSLSGFRIHRSTSPGGPYSVVRDVGADQTTFRDSGLAESTTYYYRVTAVKVTAESYPSNEAGTTTYSRPSAPRDLQAQPQVGSVVLSWRAPSEPATPAVTGYRVYRATASGSLAFLASTTGTGYADPDIAPGTTYRYAVSAVNLVGEGPMSAEASATTYDRPGAPRDLVASYMANAVVLDWRPPAPPEPLPIQAYRVYRGESPEDKTLHDSVSGTQNSYADTRVTAGKTYYYEVSAVNAIGEGARSNEAAAGVSPDAIATHVPGHVQGATADLPSAPVPGVIVEIPGVDVPATCGLDACHEDAVVPGHEVEPENVETPGIPVPEVCVLPRPNNVVCVGPFTIPPQYVTTTPEVVVPEQRLDAPCETAAPACRDEAHVGGKRVFLADGKNPEFWPHVFVAAGFEGLDLAVTPHVGDIERIGPFYANATLPVIGEVPIVVCENLCVGPVPPRFGVSTVLVVTIVLGEAILGEGVVYSARIPLDVYH